MPLLMMNLGAEVLLKVKTRFASALACDHLWLGIVGRLGRIVGDDGAAIIMAGDGEDLTDQDQIGVCADDVAVCGKQCPRNRCFHRRAS